MVPQPEGRGGQGRARRRHATAPFLHSPVPFNKMAASSSSSLRSSTNVEGCTLIGVRRSLPAAAARLAEALASPGRALHRLASSGELHYPGYPAIGASPGAVSSLTHLGFVPSQAGGTGRGLARVRAGQPRGRRAR